MKCILCHAQVPEGLSECLECGTSVSYNNSDGEALPDKRQVAQQPLVIQATPQPQRSSEILQTPPTTMPFQEIGSSRTSLLSRKGFLVLGTIVITIIIAGNGLFLYLARLNSTNSPSLGQTNHTYSTQKLVGPVPTSTSATQSNPYPPYTGTFRVNDSLQDNSGVFNWMDDSVSPNSENQGCRFTDGAYHIVNTGMARAYMIYCIALNSSLANFTYQIQATLLKGNAIGIVFRQAVHYRYYYFAIWQDGSYALEWNNGTDSRILTRGSSPAIHKGLGQPNTLAVVAMGTTLDLYVNKQHVTSVTDDSYAGGRIGTAIQSDDGSPSDAAFTHLMLWF